jgi:uncharacterized protein YkvS
MAIAEINGINVVAIDLAVSEKAKKPKVYRITVVEHKNLKNV